MINGQKSRPVVIPEPDPDGFRDQVSGILLEVLWHNKQARL